MMFVGSTHNLNKLGCEEPIMVNAKPIPRISTQMCLGVKLDENLNWDSHITLICKKVGAAIGVMRRMKPFIPMHTLESVYKSLVQPYFDYCSPLWDTCGKLLRDKLQKFQSRAARVVTGANSESRSADVLNSLSWDTLENRRSGAKSVLMYKILNDHTAPALRGSSLWEEKWIKLITISAILQQTLHIYYLSQNENLKKKALNIVVLCTGISSQMKRN